MFVSVKSVPIFNNLAALETKSLLFISNPQAMQVSSVGYVVHLLEENFISHNHDHAGI